MLLLKYLQMLLALVEFNQVLNSLIYAILEAFEFIERLVREILGWRLVFLHTFKIADDLLRTRLLFIDYALEIVELFVNFLGDFILQPLLVPNALLHFLAFLQIICALFLYILQMLQMHIRCLLERERLAPVVGILEVALITECRIMRAAINLQLICVLAKLYLVVHIYVET